MRRVVVTGMGLLTSIGNDKETSWNNLLNAKSGIKKINHFNVDDLPAKIAGYLNNNPDGIKTIVIIIIHRTGAKIHQQLTMTFVKTLSSIRWVPCLASLVSFYFKLMRFNWFQCVSMLFLMNFL